MIRYAAIAGALATMLQSTQSVAVTVENKAATCKFGADYQKLQGEAREVFLKKCMADEDEPRGPAASGGPSEQVKPKN
jgi:hypothetical protein